MEILTHRQWFNYQKYSSIVPNSRVINKKYMLCIHVAPGNSVMKDLRGRDLVIYIKYITFSVKNSLSRASKSNFLEDTADLCLIFSFAFFLMRCIPILLKIQFFRFSIKYLFFKISYWHKVIVFNFTSLV